VFRHFLEAARRLASSFFPRCHGPCPAMTAPRRLPLRAAASRRVMAIGAVTALDPGKG
jgi:hypothetical protein